MGYPNSVFNPGTLTDGVDYPQAAHVNDVRAEIAAIETALLGTITHALTVSTGISAANLTVSGGSTFVGAAVFSTGVTLSTGTLTLNQGQIVFPATQVASASTTALDDYRESTWTPTDGSGAGLALTVNLATYTKVGRLITAQIDVTYPATVNGATAQIDGLPTPAANVQYSMVSDGTTSYLGVITVASGLQFVSGGANKTNANLTGARMRGSLTYFA